jgi:hypothetical protein
MHTAAAILLIAIACGQAEPAAEEKPVASAADEALAAFQRDAEGYVMTKQDGRPVRLDFSSKPLLHWGNPARNGEDGAVYVWLHKGRPEVIGSIFTYRAINGSVIRKHAFHSLSQRPITAEFDSRTIWSPESPGVTWSPVPGADPPADDARRRLTQMRAISRKFRAELVDLREQKTELRLLTQPLLRYSPESAATIDGAIFSLAVGTDPEALLLLEARESEGKTRWEFAFARFHFVTLTAWHDDQQVWHVEPDRDMTRTVFGNDPDQRGKPYYSVAKP